MQKTTTAPKTPTAVVETLARGEGTAAAATVAGVTPSTVQRWLRERPELRRDVADHRRALLARAAGKGSAILTRALDALDSVMSDPDASRSEVTRAATAAGRLALGAAGAVDSAELAARLTAAEAALADLQSQGKARRR